MPHTNAHTRIFWYLLLLIPFVAVLWPPFYNSVEPVILGFPFFYFYQMLWVILSGIIIAIVYFAVDSKRVEGDDA